MLNTDVGPDMFPTRKLHAMFHAAGTGIFVYYGQLCFTICLCLSPDFVRRVHLPVVLDLVSICLHDMFVYFSPDLNGYTECFTVQSTKNGLGLDMFHDMSVHQSGLRRAQGTQNEALTLQDPQKVSKPKYEATALHSHPSTGYPNSTNGNRYVFTICLFISPDLDGHRAYIDPARPQGTTWLDLKANNGGHFEAKAERQYSCNKSLSLDDSRISLKNQRPREGRTFHLSAPAR